MAMWEVRVGVSKIIVEARNKQQAKLKAARSYVRKYPNANVDTNKVLTQYKLRVRKL